MSVFSSQVNRAMVLAQLK